MMMKIPCPTFACLVAVALWLVGCSPNPTEPPPEPPPWPPHPPSEKITYAATKVKTNQPGEEDLTAWKGKYEMTLKNEKEKRKVGDEEQPVLNFSSKLPDGISDRYEAVVPDSGTFALGKKTGDEIVVTRFIGDVGATLDRNFKDGSLKVNNDGSLVLKYKIEGVQVSSARSEGTINATWEFTLVKKE